MVAWRQCRDAFEADGSLRDIYIVNAGAAVWELALTFLRSAGSVRFDVDGQPAALPPTARQALGLRIVSSPCLSIQRDGLEFACHFFAEEEVELDFLTSAINGPETFESLMSFVRDLATATDREVLVAPENQSDRAFLRYDPRAERFTFAGVSG